MAGTHELVEFDLGDWDRAQRSQLELLAVGEGLPFSWRSQRFVVNADAGERAAALIDAIPAPFAARQGLRQSATNEFWLTDAITKSWRPDVPPALHLPRVGSPGRRLIGSWIDSIITAPVIAIAAVAAERNGIFLGRWVGALLTAGYHFVAVGRWDRTIGKAAVGLRVERRSGGRPGWVASAVRAVISPASAAAGVLVAGAGARGWLLLAAWVAIPIGLYGGILVDPLRRSLADRAAGTVVIRPLGRAAQTARPEDIDEATGSGQAE